MHPVILLAAVLLLVPRLAQAQEGGHSQPPPPRLGSVDLRLNGSVHSFLSAVQASAILEVGVLSLGPGGLALGGEASITGCLLPCVWERLTDERRSWRTERSVLGRLSYHFQLQQRSGRRAEIYAVAVGGVTHARTEVRTPSFAYDGHGRGTTVGAGAGGIFFFTPSLFIAGEARLNFARSPYTLTLREGEHEFEEDEKRWGGFALNTLFSLGLRL